MPTKTKAKRRREPRYIADYFNVEQIIWDTLDRIRERDGDKIGNEVAERLTACIAADVAIADGKLDHLR